MPKYIDAPSLEDFLSAAKRAACEVYSTIVMDRSDGAANPGSSRTQIVLTAATGGGDVARRVIEAPFKLSVPAAEAWARGEVGKIRLGIEFQGLKNRRGSLEIAEEDDTPAPPVRHASERRR